MQCWHPIGPSGKRSILAREVAPLIASVTIRGVMGPLDGKVFTWDDHDTCVFGRDSDSCGVRLPNEDEAASRVHFMLEVDPPEAHVLDLGSRTGTWLNGRRLGAADAEATAQGQPLPASALLGHGDRIRAGISEFVVEIIIPDLCAGCGVVIHPNFLRVCRETDLGLLCPLCQRAQPSSAPPESLDSDHVAPLSSTTPVSGLPRDGAPTRPDALGAFLQMRQEGRSWADLSVDAFPGYRLERPLRQGGQGAVFLARRDQDGEKVAIKILHARRALKEAHRRRFIREFQMGSVRHPNLVECYDFGIVDDGMYLVLEYCGGGSLHDRLKAAPHPMSVAEATPYMLGLLDGLIAFHGAGNVHRDIKPENVLLQGTSTPKLGDLGLAKFHALAGRSQVTRTREGSMGTLQFMPQEQLVNFKYVGPVSDVWSMAATFYFLLTREWTRDFSRGEDKLKVVLNHSAIPLRDRAPNLPRALCRAIDAALTFRAEDRIQTAAELKRELLAAL